MGPPTRSCSLCNCAELPAILHFFGHCRICQKVAIKEAQARIKDLTAKNQRLHFQLQEEQKARAKAEEALHDRC